MKESFIYRVDAIELVSALFILMLGAIFIGSKLGKTRFEKYGENVGNGTIVSSLFGLFAFLLAFTFGMSSSRFDSRREALVNEANAIGTAMLRSDLYTDTLKTAFRNDFKAYTEARIFYYQAGWNSEKLNRAKETSDSAARSLWKRAADIAKNDLEFVKSNQMIIALNEMFDSATTRNFRETARVPDSVVIMLFVLSLASSFYAGYISVGKGRLDWFIIISFCLLTSMVTYITLDLNRPRRGLINMDATHQAMLDLRELY